MKIYRSNKRQNRRRQEQRQQEAIERQEKYDKLTAEQKLNKLGKHRAKRQRSKLEGEIAKR